jgi:hypothetical protein
MLVATTDFSIGFALAGITHAISTVFYRTPSNIGIPAFCGTRSLIWFFLRNDELTLAYSALTHGSCPSYVQEKNRGRRWTNRRFGSYPSRDLKDNKNHRQNQDHPSPRPTDSSCDNWHLT